MYCFRYNYHIMGMFDTIIFPRPIKCSVCGKEYTSTQTKQFENLMIHYEVGDVLPGTFITGIIEETLFCSHELLKEEKGPSSTQSVYVAIWHNILIDVAKTYEDADRKVRSFGTGDLYLLYQNLHKKRNHFRVKSNRVVNWCKEYAEYLSLSPEEREKYKETGLPTWTHSMVLQYIKKESPLKEFLRDIEAQEDFSDLFF